MWAGSILCRDRCSWNLAAASRSRGGLFHDRWEPRNRAKQLPPISVQASTAFQIPPAEETRVDSCVPLMRACSNGHKPYLGCWHERRCISYSAVASARWPVSAQPPAFRRPLPPNPLRSSLFSLLSFSEPCSNLEDVLFECELTFTTRAKFGCHKLFKVRFGFFVCFWVFFLCIPPGLNQPVSVLPGCCHSLVSGSGDASCWEAKWPPVNRLTPQRFEF